MNHVNTKLTVCCTEINVLISDEENIFFGETHLWYSVFVCIMNKHGSKCMLNKHESKRS